jgi:hypothetical protein
LNTLRKVERAGNFKSNASPEFLEGRMPFLQRFARVYALGWLKSPLVRERVRGEEEGGGVSEKEDVKHF